MDLRSPDLKNYTTAQLRGELASRPGEARCPHPCIEGIWRELDSKALEEARAQIAAGDLAEAAVWIGRAHPDLDGLPALVARALRSA